MKPRQKTEFGDFQTPDALAAQVVRIVHAMGVNPASIVEPTCGAGSFVEAAIKQFPLAEAVFALELNPRYFHEADRRIRALQVKAKLDLRRADFFKFDWPAALAGMPEPILVIGNPPWVTASELGAMQSENLPGKTNFQKRRGLDAVTGKSNFDIAEWMFIRLLESLKGRRATLAMLLKTAVARKVLFHAWKTDLSVANARILTIDAGKHFGVAADACLLVCDLRPGASVKDCTVFDLEHPGDVQRVITYHDGLLLADKSAFKQFRHLQQEPAKKPAYRWRSGIKHDCAPVMELHRVGQGLWNGLGEAVSIEPDFLYPMLKGSDLARDGLTPPSRFMIVTQQEPGQDTGQIARIAPQTWEYLSNHAGMLDARASSIYRKRPKFSVFGVGPYTFAPWKVAICAMYKRFSFKEVGSYEHKPIVLDDTCYHFPCQTQAEAELLGGILNHDVTREFFGAFVFWDAKRPITVDILARLDVTALAAELRVRDRLFSLRPDLADKATRARVVQTSLHF